MKRSKSTSNIDPKKTASNQTVFSAASIARRLRATELVTPSPEQEELPPLLDTSLTDIEEENLQMANAAELRDQLQAANAEIVRLQEQLNGNGENQMIAAAQPQPHQNPIHRNVNTEAMINYVSNAIQTNSRLSHTQRRNMSETTQLANALMGTDLPEQATFLINRTLASQAGTAMGGWRNGAYIAACMDADRMGIPRPAQPTANFGNTRTFGRRRGGAAPKKK